MAIGINPQEVQQALTPNNMLGEIANRNLAIGQQMKQQQLAAKRQADEDAFNYDRYVNDKYNLGTGTPFDKVTNSRLEQAHNALFEAQRRSKTPLSMQQRWQITSPYLSDLSQLQTNAKLSRSAIDKALEVVRKDHPELDDSRIEAAALQNTFYDEKTGELRKQIDPTTASQFFADATSDPKIMAKYLNDNQTPIAFNKDIDARFPMVQNTAPSGDKTLYDAYYTYKARPYLQFNNATKTLELPSQPIKIGDRTEPGLPNDIFNQVYSTPNAQAILIRATSKAERENPEMFKGLSEEDKYRKVGYDLLSQSTGGAAGSDRPTLNREATNTRLQMEAAERSDRRLANTERQQDRMYNLSAARLDYDMSKGARKAAEKIDDTPMAAWYNVLHGNKATTAAMPKINFYDPKLQKSVPVFDLTAIRKTQGNDGGLLDDPAGSGARFRVLYNPLNKTIGIVKYNKLQEGGYKEDLAGSEQVDAKDAGKVFSRFASQLGVSPTDWEDFYEKLKQK